RQEQPVLESLQHQGTRGTPMLPQTAAAREGGTPRHEQVLRERGSKRWNGGLPGIPSALPGRQIGTVTCTRRAKPPARPILRSKRFFLKKLHRRGKPCLFASVKNKTERRERQAITP